jgi:hypothetical protein
MPNLTIDRTTNLKGPCLLFWNNLTLYTESDVSIDPNKETWTLQTSLAGDTDQRLKDAYFKISGQRNGEVTAAILAAFCVYASMLPSTSVFGAGSPLSILSLAETVNNYVTMRNAALTKLEDLNFGTDKIVPGAFEFTCIGANNVAFNDPNRFAYITTRVLGGAITAATDATPAVITSNGHGLTNGDPISISGVLGNTAVNINGYAANVATNTFEISTTADGLNPVAGNASYTSGGTWSLGWPMMINNVLVSPFLGQWAATIPSGTISGTSDAGPDVITTSAAHGLKVNDRMVISGVAGDTAINGAFYVLTAPSTTTLTISATQGGAAIAGAGTYTSGGTWTRANGLDGFDSEAGMQISFNLSLTQKRTQGLGTYDFWFKSLTVSAKGLPVGVNGASVTTLDIIAALNIQGSGVQLGQSMAAEGQDLYLQGNGLYFRLYQAFIKSDKALYSSEKLRQGDFQWQGTRRFAGNTLKPLYAVSTSPITS